MCLKKDLSCLNKIDKESMLFFIMEKVYKEFKVKVLFFYCLLVVVSINRRSRFKVFEIEVLYVGIVIVICLRNRFKFMSVV